MKIRQYISDRREKPPEWYWSSGLHDACIIGVETAELPFDYARFEVRKNRYDRNLFLMRIDGEGAIFDSTVREIRLYNYQILSRDISLENRKKVWWLSDRLTQREGKYFLEIDLQDFDGSPQDFTFKIQFDRAEVIREQEDIP